MDVRQDVWEIDISARCERKIVSFRTEIRGDSALLGIVAMVLLVLWLLGFFAFHITAGLFHIVLGVGLVLLVLHLFSSRSAAA